MTRHCYLHCESGCGGRGCVEHCKHGCHEKLSKNKLAEVKEKWHDARKRGEEVKEGEVEEKEIVHVNVECDCCKQCPIKGPVWHCSCALFDEDFCDKCWEAKGDHEYDGTIVSNIVKFQCFLQPMTYNDRLKFVENST